MLQCYCFFTFWLFGHKAGGILTPHQGSNPHPLHWSESVNHSVVSYSLCFHGLESARLLCPRNSPGNITGMGCHSLLQGIFLTWGLNPGLLQCRQIICCLSHQGSPPTSIQTGNCHRPLHILNHELLQLLTFNTPWKELRVESRNEALCALGKMAERAFR